MEVINKGVFEPIWDDNYHIVGLTPIEFDINNRELWLSYIQHINSHWIGSSNYTTDFIENWNLIFRVNSGKGEGKSYKNTEGYFMVLQIQIATWCRPKNMIKEDVLKALNRYPIIYMSELLDAFEQRDFYRNSELIKIYENNNR